MKINGISTTINIPNKSDNKLAILMPGYLDSKDYDHFKFLGIELANIGYLAIAFNPTGTWDSDGSVENYSISQYLKDIETVIKYAENQNGKEFSEIALLGHSLGGQTALLYGSNHEKISAVIGIMPSASVFKVGSVQRAMPKWLEDGFRNSKRDLPNNPAEIKEFKIPYSFFEDRTNYDVFETIKNYNNDLLLIAGETDVIIKPESVQEICDKATNCSRKEMVTVPGIGHDYRH